MARSDTAVWSIAYPQVWNSGASMNIRSCTRYGMRDRIDASGDSPGRECRSAPLGRPVVPELSTIVRPALAGGPTGAAGAASMSLSSSDPGPPAVMACTRSGTAARKSPNSSSAITTSTPC